MCRSILILVCCLLVATGCATINSNQIAVTLHSEPSGAMLYEGQTAIGIAPKVWFYNKSAANPSTGEILTRPLRAVWSSGASVEMPLRLALSLGSNQTYTFSRPPNAPGLDQDLRFALQLEQASQQRRAAEQANGLAQMELGARLMQQGQPRPATNAINCTSYQAGIFTNVRCQ